ncbi:MAG TPA: ribosome maturation factor RimM [Alphaproteobacteria bacterium]|nr:ribosome maturation factor RimM [Alphaproteobacteria bacterium]
MTAPRILIGTLGAPHGVKGLVKVFPLSGQPDLFASPRLFYTQPQAGRGLKVSLARVGPKSILIAVEGVTDRTAAEELTGLKLYLPRADFPDLEPGAYYHADLIGLCAVDGRGRAVGVVAGVENFGAGDLLEVRPDTGESFYVPFADSFVPEVDLHARTVRVEGAEEFSNPKKKLES